MKKPLSLTLRLFLLVSALNIVTMVIVGMLSMHSVNINISEDYDAQLITEASILWEILEEDSKDGRMSAFHVESFDAEQTAPLLERIEQDSMMDYAQWRAFRVWHKSKIVMQSDNLDEKATEPMKSGLSNVKIGSDTWRAFSLHDPQNDLIVETYENLHNRDILEHDILLDTLATLVVMLPLLGILFSYGIRFGLKGLRNLANRLSTRSPADLSQLKSDDMPREIKPLVNSLNMLLSKVERSIAHEREFIDHAAHELRTPLSALKLQAQLLAQSSYDKYPAPLLTELLASVDRTARLVTQLLLLSRVSHQNIVFEDSKLYTIIKDAVSLHAMLIVDKNISLNLVCDEKLMITTQPELLRTLISTILDNAVKYTPKKGEITITVNKQPEHLQIMISDSGEGIPEGERERVFDRFYRVSDTKQPGSGLGLAIASQITQKLGGSIQLATPTTGKGLAVMLDFPSLLSQ